MMVASESEPPKEAMPSTDETPSVKHPLDVHWVLQSLFNEDGIRIASYTREPRLNLWEIYNHKNELLAVADSQEHAKEACERYVEAAPIENWFNK